MLFCRLWMPVFLFTFGFANQSEEDDAVASQDLRVGGDKDKRYFLVGPKERAKEPRDGYRLLVVMPGGDGSADFHPFVKRIYENALGDDYLLAQPVAMRWTKSQEIVWPTQKSKVPKMKFSTEEFVGDVIADVRKKHRIDSRYIFTLSWSSSGPAAYVISLEENTSVTGSLVTMSVFHPDDLRPMKRARGRSYYILHSPEDSICPFRLAEEARDTLKKHGAQVEFRSYSGGHGWKEDPYGHIRRGIQWLEKNHALVPSAKKP